MLILGIDEAGRGPVIGPMVIAGVLDTEHSSITYSQMGCKDSKMLSPNSREKLAEKVMKKAKEVRTVEIPASEIDFLRATMSLNEIEAKKVAELVLSFDEKPDKLIIDCPDVEPARFLRRLQKYLGPEVKAVLEHKADVNYPIVSAASIIAKVQRDSSVRKLENMYGPLGTGYPHDPLTKAFLEKCFSEDRKFPSCVRKTWITAQEFFNKEYQKSILDY
ncbi:MAG: ribonuclease HII [Candidatus Diapherotrites archaeon]|nr:ribonuclease HII [Candidatus Diapherotrites archaeon]